MALDVGWVLQHVGFDADYGPAEAHRFVADGEIFGAVVLIPVLLAIVHEADAEFFDREVKGGDDGAVFTGQDELGLQGQAEGDGDLLSDESKVLSIRGGWRSCTHPGPPRRQGCPGARLRSMNRRSTTDDRRDARTSEQPAPRGNS